MIKIPLSYRIIKNNVVDCDDNAHSIIETQMESSFNEEEANENEEEWNLSKEIERIKKELTEEMAKEKEEMIHKVMEESKVIKENATKEGFEAGFQQGLSSGYEEGISRAKEEANTLKNNAVSIIEQAQKEVTEYFTQKRKSIIQLAIDMAESIINTTIDSSSENVMLLIKPILQQYGKRESIIISTHPENSDFIRGSLNEIENLCPGTKVFVLENKNMEKNGCIIENEHQIIDLQIKKQLSCIKSQIMQME